MPNIVIDKNFLQAESSAAPNLKKLAERGYQFALPDVLIYEICSDEKNIGLWKSLKLKLGPYANRISILHCSGELLRDEVRNLKPIKSPVHEQATQQFRYSLQHSKQLPDIDRTVIAQFRKHREVEKYLPLAQTFRSFGEYVQEAFQRSADSDRDLRREEFPPLVNPLLDNSKAVTAVLNKLFCNQDRNSDLYLLPAAAASVDEEWFLYRFTRTHVAFFGEALRRYGLNAEPSSKFVNAQLDMDYLVHVHYTDGIASNETRGEMKRVFDCLFRHEKEFLSSPLREN